MRKFTVVREDGSRFTKWLEICSFRGLFNRALLRTGWNSQTARPISVRVSRMAA